MILVTGAAGYLGSHLMDCLNNAIGFDNLSNPFWLKQIENLIVGDINDYQIIDAIFRNNDIDIVIHLAGVSNCFDSTKRPSKYFHTNVSGTLNILSACARYKVPKFVYLSSLNVYRNQEKPVSEQDSKKPINTLGISQLMCELAINRYSMAYDIDSLILRVASVVGGVVGRKDIVSQAIKKDEIDLYGNKVVDYIHIKDAIKAIQMLIEKDEYNEIYNISSGKETTELEMIEIIRQYKDIEVNQYDIRQGESEYLVGDNSKLKEIGWKPTYSLKRIVEYSLKHYESFKKAM